MRSLESWRKPSSKIQTTHDNCPEGENYWSRKCNDKMLSFFFLKDNLCEFHLREQFFCRNKPINPVLIVRKLQYDYRAF